jgi:hypothetical protein
MMASATLTVILKATETTLCKIANRPNLPKTAVKKNRDQKNLPSGTPRAYLPLRGRYLYVG